MKKGKRSDLISLLHVRVASVSVSASALRGQGAKGVVAAARKSLVDVNLRSFKGLTPSGFRRRLDAETEQVRRRLPAKARHWGAARKALNIYLRGVVYNRHLCAFYKLAKIERFL